MEDCHGMQHKGVCQIDGKKKLINYVGLLQQEQAWSK